MWINIDDDKAQALLAVTGGDALTEYLQGRVRHYQDEAGEAENRYYREAAQNQSREGDWEVDPDAVVSMGDDPGAYVMAWKWISKYEAGIPGPCLTCGTQCDEEGICPVCAALEDAQEELREAKNTFGVDSDMIPAYQLSIDEALKAPIDSCRKCGKSLILRDVQFGGGACTDQGEDAEECKVFVYCSEHCRETH